MPAGEPSIPSDPMSPTATGRFFIAYTEEGLSPTPEKPEAVACDGLKNAGEEYDDACVEEPPKEPPNAVAGEAATHPKASARENAATTFRARRHIADAQAKRCAGGAEARARCACSVEDKNVASS